MDKGDRRFMELTEKVAEWSQEILYESYYDKINAIYDGLKQIDITNPKPDQLTALSELHLFENLLDSFSENKDELIAAKAQEIIDLLTGKYVDEILEEEES